VSLEQIRAREERLKRIKDEALIQIFDANEESVKDTAKNLAEAFLAKKRAK
jgi:hypothetical protein